MRSLPFAFTIVPVALLFSACRPSVGELCKEQCVCSPCTDYDLERCEAKENEIRTKAENGGCSDLYDSYLTCRIATVNCKGLAPDDKGCATERTVLNSCAKITSACEEAQIHVAECTGQPPPPPFDPNFECSGEQECQSQCVVDATCDEILGISDPSNFNQCINNCFGPIPD